MANNQTSSTISLEKKRSSSPSDLEEVRILGIAEYEQAAQCLAEAFAVDEVARYFIDTDDMASYSEDYKWKLHVDILRYIVSAHCYKGMVTTIGPDYDAVALWMPPGKNMDDWWTILRSGMWRLLYKLSREGKKRFYNEFLPLLHDTKHKVMGARDDHSWYLVYIGSKPSARGKGYARKLIEHGCALADRAGQATYLESSAAGNQTYYEKYGFTPILDIAMTRGPKPVKMHIMVREPKSTAESADGKRSEQTVEIREL